MIDLKEAMWKGLVLEFIFGVAVGVGIVVAGYGLCRFVIPHVHLVWR